MFNTMHGQRISRDLLVDHGSLHEHRHVDSCTQQDETSPSRSRKKLSFPFLQLRSYERRVRPTTSSTSTRRRDSKGARTHHHHDLVPTSLLVALRLSLRRSHRPTTTIPMVEAGRNVGTWKRGIFHKSRRIARVSTCFLGEGRAPGAQKGSLRSKLLLLLRFRRWERFDPKRSVGILRTHVTS